MTTTDHPRRGYALHRVHKMAATRLETTITFREAKDANALMNHIWNSLKAKLAPRVVDYLMKQPIDKDLVVKFERQRQWLEAFDGEGFVLRAVVYEVVPEVTP